MRKTGLVVKWSQWVTHHPWWIISLTAVFLIVAGPGLTRLDFKNDYRVYFGDTNPELKAYTSIQSVYNKSDNILFVVEPDEASVFNVNTLQALAELTQKAWQLPYSSRVDSIINFQHTVADGDNLLVGDLVTGPEALTKLKLESIKQIALNEPQLVNRLVSASGHVSGVNVTLQLPAENAFEVIEVAGKARELAAAIESKYPGVKLHLSGMVMMNNAFAESVMHDYQTLVPAMCVVLFAMLMLCLRSVSATLAVVLLILFSIGLALSLTGWIGWFLTPTSITAPTIILTMAVADCVHLLVTQLHSMRLGLIKRLAIVESLRINFQPIFLTSLTTAIGFLSMNFSDAPPFRDLGNIVAIGVLWAWFLSITFLPALMMVLPVRVRLKDDLDSSIMDKLSEFVIRRRKPLLIFNGLFATAMISFAPLNDLNDEFVKYFDHTVEFRQATDFLNANMGGIYTVELSVHAESQGGVNEPAYLKQLAGLVEWLKQQPEVKNVNTITDIFKRLNKNMHQDQPEWYKLPERRELAAQYLLLYEMSLPYGLDLNDQVNIDKSSVRIIVTLESMSSNQMLAFEQRIRGWLSHNMGGLMVDIASPILMFAHIGQRNIIRMVGGTLTALVLISAILILAFRSLKLGLISLIPNLVPAGIAFGIWALIDGSIGLGLSVVIGMTLGIVVDDTVHFISKYKRARIEKALDSQEAVRYAFSTVGVAMWFTSVVLVCGFIVLGFSHFTMNSGMGLMTAITIIIALLMDLLLLPALLMSLEKK
ncbi:MAG: efflux RND transporter permease subunit [Gammaproteobacteria bacterium]